MSLDFRILHSIQIVVPPATVLLDILFDFWNVSLLLSRGWVYGLFGVEWSLGELKKGETFASLLNIHGGDIRVVATHLGFITIRFSYLPVLSFFCTSSKRIVS